MGRELDHSHEREGKGYEPPPREERGRLHRDKKEVLKNHSTEKKRRITQGRCDSKE